MSLTRHVDMYTFLRIGRISREIPLIESPKTS